MSAEISFANSFQLLIILLLIIGIGCYFYYDNYKIKKSISDLNYKINSLLTDDNPEMHMFDIHQNKQTMNSELSKGDIIDKEDYPESQSEKYPTQLPQKTDIPELFEEFFPNQSALELEEESSETEKLNKIKQEDEKNEWEEINNLMINIQEENNNIKEISDKNTDNIEVQDDNKDLDNIDDMLNNLLIQNNEPHDDVNNVDYSKMTVSELKKILVEKNLPVSGNKTKLIKRITENE